MADAHKAKIGPPFGRIPWNKGLIIGDRIRKKKLYERRECLECSKDIFTYPSVNKRFCNLSCRSKTTARSYPKKGKPIYSIRGEKHYNWRGGAGTVRHRIMQQAEYIQWRDAVFARDNYTCQICNEYGGYLHGDHIKSWTNHEELRFEVSNGRSLCRACHFYITFKRKMPSTSRWGLTRKAG